ncbi:hypothetical protein PENTCL1PPCAC_17206, partial [Pristionchus entomophagus]
STLDRVGHFQTCELVRSLADLSTGQEERVEAMPLVGKSPVLVVSLHTQLGRFQPRLGVRVMAQTQTFHQIWRPSQHVLIEGNLHIRPNQNKEVIDEYRGVLESLLDVDIDVQSGGVELSVGVGDSHQLEQSLTGVWLEIIELEREKRRTTTLDL